MFTSGSFALSSSQARALGREQQVPLEKEEEKDVSLSQMYGEQSSSKKPKMLSNDLFGNLSSLVTKPAADFNKGRSFSQLTSKSSSLSSKFPSTEPQQQPGTKDSQSSQSAKRKHIKIAPLKMDYNNSSDSTQSKKLKTSVFSRDSENGIFGGASKKASSSAQTRSFSSVKEFFDWVS
jgi:hypothetical protein